MCEVKLYDTIIIGGGPAGYTAALYASRAGLKTLVVEKFSAGGQMTQTMQIDNYPGFDEGIDGFALGMKMEQGAKNFGAEVVRAEVVSASLVRNIKVISTDSDVYNSKTVIIATGAEHKRLGVEDEEALVGRGLGYCAACDGMLYKGKTVAVVGGGNSAAADALLLSRICKKVYLIHRRDTLRATKIYHAPLMAAENVEFKWNSVVKKLHYDKKINGVTVVTNSDTEERLDIDGIFISIGRAPVTALFEGQISLDANGYIIADETTKTNIDGVFAVGDVRTKEVRQIITAAADGAVAVHYAEKYLAK